MYFVTDVIQNLLFREALEALEDMEDGILIKGIFINNFRTSRVNSYA